MTDRTLAPDTGERRMGGHVVSEPKYPAWGFAVPQVLEGRQLNLSRVRHVVRVAESVGVHSLWVSQQIIGRPRTLEALTLLSYVAALSERVRLGTAVLLSGLHQPVQLAKQLASLDQLSRGRLIVGIGVGNPSEYETLGLDPAERAARFEESATLLLRLWRGGPAFEGRFWDAQPAVIEVKPWQKPNPPLWFGGSRRPALRRGVRLGDGWIGSGGNSLEEFRAQAAIVRDELAAAERAPASFAMAKRAYIAVEPTRRAAQERLAPFFEVSFGSAARARTSAITGDASECADRLAELRASGAQLVVLNPVYEEERQYDRICADVLPRLEREAP